KSTQGGGEVQTDLLFHLDLIDAHEVEFNRILGRHDVGLNGVERLKRGIESVGFAAPRWSRNQDHSVGLRDIALKLNERLRLETKLGHVKHQVFFIKQTKHNLLAKKSRQGGNTKIQLARSCVNLDLDLDAPILRQALFGNVELRHDLHTRN